jgi:uncharacterized protein (DUF885 family)
MARWMNLSLAVAALGAVLGAVLAILEPARALALQPSPTPTAADERFKMIYEKEWRWRQAQLGSDQDDETSPVSPRLPDVSPGAQALRLAYWSKVKTALQGIDSRRLSPAQRTNFEVYQAQIAVLLANQRFHEWEKPLNADTFFWGEPAAAARRPLKTERDYRNYISLLNDIPRYFSQETDNMRAGLARGFTPPQVTLLGRDDTIASVVRAKTAADSLFYRPFIAMPAVIPAADQAALRSAAVSAIQDKVIPAHVALLRFMRETYIPNARKTLAAEALPDGKAYYQAKLLEFTTLDLTPEAIHDIGLKEVASIRRQMLDVMKAVDFQGDLPAFLTFLRTDKQFYATTPLQLLKEASYIAKEFDGKASTYFGHLPRSRFAIKPVPADIAPYFTGGRGGPGVYLVNTYDLPSRPLYSLRALTLHESAPGHAFQMPLADENKSQPEFRRRTYISAYGEGWALYCEKLGDEMGMYETPYDRFGMLSYQMWRAARLVVDTGIHAQGWTRDQAQQYLRDNTALSEHEIETEVDRYIAWPGQADSYYLGEMAIVHGRERAERALGPRFNIRAFHDAVLALGSAPLPVLDQAIDAFIASGGQGPYPDEE